MSAKCDDFQAEVPTGSMFDVYKAARPALDQYLEHIRTQPNQVGLACAINGKTAGIDIFEDTNVFNQFFRKLIRAYAAEVVTDDRVATMVPGREALRQLLSKVLRIRCDEYEAVVACGLAEE
jgi:methyl coenzyme M reductase beta subunit